MVLPAFPVKSLFVPFRRRGLTLRRLIPHLLGGRHG